MRYTRDFSTARMWPLMMKMALPSIVAQVVNMLYCLVDRVYIGHIRAIGTDALAGIGISSTIVILVSAFSAFAGNGGAPLAAIALGQQDDKEARRILGSSMFLLIVLTVLLLVPCYLFMEPILRATGASDATLPHACRYLSVYLTGTFFVMVTMGLNSFINAQGRPGIAMATVIIGALLNIILDPIFIFVFRMEVVGAALASVLSQAVGAIWVLRFLTSEKAELPLLRSCIRPDGRVIGRIMALGVSPFVMGSTESLIGFVLNRGLAVYGDIQVSAMAIMQGCMQLVSAPGTGFTTGIAPILSYNYGHGDKARVKECFRNCFLVMTGSNLVFVLWMILCPRFFGSFFTSDQALLDVVEHYMPLFLLGMTIFGMQRACQSTFISLNQPRVSLFIALLRKVFLLVPLALVLPRFLGLPGIYAAEAIADAVAATCCITIFLRLFPKILAGPGATRY